MMFLPGFEMPARLYSEVEATLGTPVCGSFDEALLGPIKWVLFLDTVKKSAAHRALLLLLQIANSFLLK